MKRNSKWLSLHGLLTLLLVGLSLYVLVVEHAEHILPFLPYLVLLLCPLMHVFMHKGHHHRGSHHQVDEEHRPDHD